MKEKHKQVDMRERGLSGGAKSVASSILISGLIIAGAIVLVNSNNNDRPIVVDNQNADNVSIVDGKQIVEINAKGGYYPRISAAKSGVQTILRFNTSGTFDCSAAVRIPKMDITEYLPPSGATDIDLGIQPRGTLQGTCGMGMYPFEIDFR